MAANTLSSAYNLDADVRTLAEARRIEGDAKRLKAAKLHARKKLAEQQQKLASIARERVDEPPPEDTE